MWLSLRFVFMYFGKKSQKKMSNHSPEQLSFRWVSAQQVVFGTFFSEIWAKVKKPKHSEIKPPLVILDKTGDR